MKNKISSILVFCCVLTLRAQAVTISNFGVSSTSLGSTGWLYSGANSSLTGTEGLGDALYNVTPFSLNITGQSSLSLTANASVAPTDSFTVSLTDNAGLLANATFKWSNFVGGSTQSSPLTFQANFNRTNVIGYEVDSSGSGQTLNVSFTQLSAVPEPSTYTLLGLSLVGAGFIAAKKRKLVS